MIANSQKFWGGLLSGFGSGIQQVGANRISQEREKAEKLRQENLARFNADEAMKRQKDQQGFLKQQAGTKSSEVASTLESIVDGKPVTIMYDATGKQIGQPIPRSMNAAEVKASGAGGGEYDNPLYDDARKILTDKFAAEVFSDVLKQGDASTKMDSFMVQNQLTGVKELNMALVRAEYPEVAKKYDLLSQMVENGLQVNKNPQQVVEASIKQLNDFTTAEVNRQHDKMVNNLVESSNGTMKKEEVTGLMSKQFTLDELKKMSQNFDPNDPQAQILKQIRPEIYDQIIVMAKRNTLQNNDRMSGKYSTPHLINIPGAGTLNIGKGGMFDEQPIDANAKRYKVPRPNGLLE